ncbi:MAG: hypothetical protein ACFFG0_51670 [Candidatus Thorarchaeota archaeon]
MALTQFLKLKDVKSKFLTSFPKPEFSVKREILASPLTENYSLVGTAFDYLLRFLIEYTYEPTISDTWVAENSLTFLAGLIEFIQSHGEKAGLRVKALKEYYDQVNDIILNAKRNHSKFLSDGSITKNLIESTLLLAQVDIFYRAGKINENLGKINKDDVADLKNLISLVNIEIFRPKKIAFLNPRFGHASRMVGGADADLIIDDMLIEIKTTKRLEMRRDTYNQLIGYYTLYRIASISNMTEFEEIRKLGVYFSRFGYLHLYNIEDIIDEEGFPKFIEWFKERAIQYMHK